MKSLIHISPNVYPPFPAIHHTKKIWKELAQGFDEYHVLARSEGNRGSVSREGNIVLHLLPRLSRKSRSFFLTSFYLLLFVKKHRITHILCQCPLLGGVAAVVARKFWGTPVMVEIHGDVYFRYLQDRTVKYLLPRLLVRFVLRNASKVRSLSSAMTSILAGFGFSHNVVLIPNRVDTTLFDSPKVRFELGSPLTLLGIGRFVEQKGFDIAILALRILRRTVSARLVLVGGGPLHERLTALAGNDGSVELLGWVEQTALRDLMKKADIYIQPSKPLLGEAMPRTILEAMAMRLPIVSTRVAAIPGVLVEGENGLLVEPGNPEALAEAILTLVRDEGLRGRIAKRAHADVLEKYEWKSVFAVYLREIETMT